MRYNGLRTNCRGLKFVKPNGEIVDLTNNHKKDNIGYDLKQLLIGSEGSLGIITEASI